MPQKFSTPGVYLTEKDLSEIIAAGGTSVGAIVVRADKGPANRKVFVSDTQQLLGTYGAPINKGAAGIEYGLYGALQFLAESSQLFVCRYTDGTEKYAGVAITSAGVSTSAAVAASATSNFVTAAGTGEFREGNLFNKILELENYSVSGAIALFAREPSLVGNNIAVQIVTTASTSGFGTPNLYDWAGYYSTSADAAQVYKINVYSRNTSADSFDVNSPVETFYVSNTPNLKDATNTSLFVEDVVNGGSQYIYARAALSTYPGLTSSATPVTLSGGTTTTAASSSNEAAAWSGFFANKKTTPVNILIGGADNTVDTAIYNLAIARRDCIAAVQIGTASGDFTTLATANQTSGFNSSYVAKYGTWCQVYDTFSDRLVYLPMSFFGAAAMARVDRVGNTWDAPANIVLSPTVRALNIRLTDSEIGQLYDANLNVAKFEPGSGILLWGQKTAQSKRSALDRINVRRLLLYIENSVQSSLTAFLFQPNTDKTRNRVRSIIQGFLDTVKAGGGIEVGSVVVDSTNNTPATISANILNIDIRIQPTFVIEFINLTVTVVNGQLSVTEA